MVSFEAVPAVSEIVNTTRTYLVVPIDWTDCPTGFTTTVLTVLILLGVCERETERDERESSIINFCRHL